ncbi:unnamed protein product [Camellia sinensis]
MKFGPSGDSNGIRLLRRRAMIVSNSKLFAKIVEDPNNLKAVRFDDLIASKQKFLCRCNARDISEMQQHLNCFVDCFTECGSSGNLTLHHFINKMCKAGFCVRICPEENMAEVRERFIERMDALQETKQVRQMLLPRKKNSMAFWKQL